MGFIPKNNDYSKIIEDNNIKEKRKKLMSDIKEELENDNTLKVVEVQSIEEVPLKRSFGGKIKDFESKGEQEFEKRHLKAYLKGDKNFRCGFRTNSNGMREENWFNVIENWK